MKVASTDARYCARCKQPLRAARSKLMTIDICTSCGGAFFDRGELAKLALEHEEQFAKLEALVEPSQPVVDDRRPGERLRCPACAAGMESFQYTHCSGIWLDRCDRCGGIWVDNGELEAIATHLDGGHWVLTAEAKRMAPLMGAVPQGQQHITDEMWRSVGAVAGFLGRDPRVRPA